MRLINGFDQLFDMALETGEYPKPRFLGPPCPKMPNEVSPQARCSSVPSRRPEPVQVVHKAYSDSGDAPLGLW